MSPIGRAIRHQPTCVEVPCVVDRSGVNPTHVGEVAPQCAALKVHLRRAADGTLSGIAGKQVTVDLAGTDARNITDVAVSANIVSGQSRFAALRSFELWACNGAAGSDCSTSAGFAKVYTSAPDAFPGDAPRPICPELILRNFVTPKFKATHLQLRVLTSQCTGGPAYQGDQEATPANTDCDTGVVAASTRRFVRTAEIQAFSDDSTQN